MTGGVKIARSAAELMAVARVQSEVDILDDEAVEPLGVLLRSLNTESALHAGGARAMESYLLRMLCNRLRMRRDFRANPEIEREPIRAPIFVIGYGRTGSTKAHKILAASGDFNWMSFWMALNPSLMTGDRDESPAPRITDAAAYAAWFDAASPEVKFAHPFETHEPEEDSFVLAQSLRSPVLLGWSPIGGYMAWLMTQDMAAQIRHLRDTLKYLQWQRLASPAKRWILKCPLYPGLERELLSVFPDACLVMTHRDPLAFVPSGLRLVELFHAPFTNARSDSRQYLLGAAAAMSRHLDNRRQMSEMRILDIDFSALTEQASSAVERIYAFAGVELSVESEMRMQRWNAQNPQHRRGKHRYDLRDYDIRPEEVTEAFSRYNDFLVATFGGRAMRDGGHAVSAGPRAKS